LIDSDHFYCDDFKALDYLVMDIANERFGVKDYSSDGTKPKPSQPTQSTAKQITKPKNPPRAKYPHHPQTRIKIGKTSWHLKKQ